MTFICDGTGCQKCYQIERRKITPNEETDTHSVRIRKKIDPQNQKGDIVYSAHPKKLSH